MSWTASQPRDRFGAPWRVDKWGGEVVGRIGERWTRTAVFWCRVMHDRVSWPLNGRYHCRHCNRIYPAPWD